MTPVRKAFSFAKMMIVSQRRHEARVASQTPQPEPGLREQALRHTLQKMNGTKRLVVFM
jgi:hypothetical protein